MYLAQSDDRPDRFLAQFEWDGTDAIYRRDRFGPAYRATNDEYHAFVDDQARRRWWIDRAAVVVGLLLVAIVWFVPPFATMPEDSPTWAILVLAAAFVPLLAWDQAVRWLRHAPARVLCDRSPVAAALTKHERAIVRASDTSWSSLWWSAFICGVWMSNYLFLVGPGPRHRWLHLSAFAFWSCGLALTVARMLYKGWVERRYGKADQLANALT